MTLYIYQLLRLIIDQFEASRLLFKKQLETGEELIKLAIYRRNNNMTRGRIRCKMVWHLYVAYFVFCHNVFS